MSRDHSGTGLDGPSGPSGSDPDWRPVESPPASYRDDELLADPPRGDHHRGRLAGYGAGRGARIALLACLAVLLVGTTAVWYWLVRPTESTARQFQLPAGTDLDARPRVFIWSEGKARLGLDREPPGVDTVELPDRTLRLRGGSERAQFKVAVEGGRTVALDVVSGRIVEELKPGAEPLLRR